MLTRATPTRTTLTGTIYRPERRRRDLRGRVARVTYPVRHAVGDFIVSLPCKFVGHRWVEASRGKRREQGRRRIRFHCARCRMRAGFTN
jgi:hypothetical protein